MIYYGQFLRLCEIAETELFRAVGLPYSAVFDRLDIWLPRVQIHFDFHKPLVFDDLMVGREKPRLPLCFSPQVKPGVRISRTGLPRTPS
jgi:hypothetical protein